MLVDFTLFVLFYKASKYIGLVCLCYHIKLVRTLIDCFTSMGLRLDSVGRANVACLDVFFSKLSRESRLDIR